MTDLPERSLAHWSEAGRAGMEAFYTLATEDYRHLAEARDWAGWFEDRQSRIGERPLRLLDVACGSGKFPTALLTHAGLAAAARPRVDYALLDPSRFSIETARSALAPPFIAGSEFCCTLQALPDTAGQFDIIWAIHALYAIPEHDLDRAIERFLAALAPDGVGVIGHSAAAGHYIRFHDLFLADTGQDRSLVYPSAETLKQRLEARGAAVEVREVSYDSSAPIHARAAVEGFLQRCVFDTSLPLGEMETRPELGPYLQACAGPIDWRFPQRVWLMTITAS